MITIQDGSTRVSIDPSFGNNASSMQCGGREFLWTPRPWRAPALGGIPLLAPWANRIDGDSYLANGSRYRFNGELNNLRYDANRLPIHGLLAFAAEWSAACRNASSVSSRLEFWRFPKWMAQFPFAHAIEVTHRVREGSLEIETAIENLSREPMPLCIGYHPYFQLAHAPREQWKIHIAARERVLLSERVIPDGRRVPIDVPNPFSLAEGVLDAVFTNLTGAAFVLEAPSARLEIRFGPRYPVAIVYAPPGSPFVCIEPMTALTNSFNTPGPDLPHVAPGETWRESFWISPG